MHVSASKHAKVHGRSDRGLYLTQQKLCDKVWPSLLHILHASAELTHPFSLMAALPPSKPLLDDVLVGLPKKESIAATNGLDWSCWLFRDAVSVAGACWKGGSLLCLEQGDITTVVAPVTQWVQLHPHDRPGCPLIIADMPAGGRQEEECRIRWCWDLGTGGNDRGGMARRAGLAKADPIK